MTLPWSFGDGTPFNSNFMKQLQEDLTAFDTVTSGVNTSTWTPVLTFATPGDLSVVYGAGGQVGVYYKLGFLVYVKFVIATTTFTHTTSSGDLQITGLPFTSFNDGQNYRLGNLQWTGITAAGYTDITPVLAPAASLITLRLSGSGQPIQNVTAAQAPSAGTVDLRGSLLYVS